MMKRKRVKLWEDIDRYLFLSFFYKEPVITRYKYIYTERKKWLIYRKKNR